MKTSPFCCCLLLCLMPALAFADGSDDGWPTVPSPGKTVKKTPAPTPAPDPAPAGDGQDLTCPQVQQDLTECQEGYRSCSEGLDRVAEWVDQHCPGGVERMSQDTGITPTTQPAPCTEGDKRPKCKKRAKKPDKTPKAPEAPDKEPEAPKAPDPPPPVKGDPGEDGFSFAGRRAVLKPGKTCQAGGVQYQFGLDKDRDGVLDDEEIDPDMTSVMCKVEAPAAAAPRDGRDGRDGRPGRDGTRIQIGAGMRVSGVVSAGRPIGWSYAPTLQLQYWLSPTVEFSTDVAYADGGDQNMVVTAELCYRGRGKRLGFCGGGQYQAWNLDYNVAEWQTGLGFVAVKAVPIETKYLDINLEAGLGAGFDGYEEEKQFGWGWTGSATATFKF
jgi:hypothetical protein